MTYDADHSATKGLPKANHMSMVRVLVRADGLCNPIRLFIRCFSKALSTIAGSRSVSKLIASANRPFTLSQKSKHTARAIQTNSANIGFP